MANGIKVDEKTFETLDHDKQMIALFQAVVRTNDNLTSQYDKCEPRFKTLEKRKWVDKGIAGVTGVIGGLLGFFGIKMS